MEEVPVIELARMHLILRLIVIMSFLVELMKTCYSLTCSEINSHNSCTRIDSSTILLYCPNQYDKKIALSVFEKTGEITIRCLNQSDLRYVEDVPDLNLSRYIKMSIEDCGFKDSPKRAIEKLHMGELRHLILTGTEYVETPQMEIFDEFQLGSQLNLETLYISSITLIFKRNFLRNTPNLRNLSLNSVNFNETTMHFDDVPNLEKLVLMDNSINLIPEGCFRNLSSLSRLYIQNNKITSLNRTTFKGLKSLKTLNLDNNRIEKVASDSFSELKVLTAIGLASNNIAFLEKDIFNQNPALEFIGLNDNPLKSLPETLFWASPQLKGLNLQHLKLTSFPEGLFKHSKLLSELNMSGVGNFSSRGLPEGIFSHLPKLKVINLGSNVLRAVNMSLFQDLTNETDLDLSNNAITEFPDILRLEIRKLTLSSNSIKALKLKSIVDSRILEIDLSYNKIKKIDFSEISEDSLRKVHVNLKSNPIANDCSNIDLYRYVNKTMNSAILSNIDPKFKVAIDCPVWENCPKTCNCSYNERKGELSVDCSSRNLTSFSMKDHTFLKLIDPKLLSNSLEQSYKANFCNFVKKEFGVKLNLSGNRLTDIDSISPNIKSLDLSNNQIRRLRSSSLIQSLDNSKTLHQLYLGRNPWECNCISAELQEFLLENHKTVNTSEIVCKGNNDIQLISRAVCELPLNLNLMLPPFLGAILCLTSIFALYYRYQENIRIYLFSKNMCLSWITEEELDRDKEYDVFISYCQKDEEFVKDHLLPGLESGEKSYKVCIHERDWAPGEFISRQIFKSVSQSRRTLVVLTNSFLDSHWGKMEFLTAHTEALREGRTRVIVVIYGELDMDNVGSELKSYLSSNTYISWGEKHFWRKLRYALPHSSKKAGKLQCLEDVPGEFCTVDIGENGLNHEV
ncbi:protein toll-like isoform X2 [Euwallacea fornicatus]|uniref:protein toll-like isoform X2 n=1 Tax=Euwallacea fornicatus TaxID=995702 RepID=UPI0033901752